MDEKTAKSPNNGEQASPVIPRIEKNPVTGHNFIFTCRSCSKVVPDNTLHCPHCNRDAV